MVDRDYHEPIRDRDKNWRLASQRAILNSEPSSSSSSSKPSLALGIYPQNGDDKTKKKKSQRQLGPLVWSPALQMVARKTHLRTVATVISHTHCITKVFGFGISGRLFSEGGNNAGKFLILEVYSVWNSLKYVMMISALQLKSIFADQPSLLTTGCRQEAIQSILKRLYFIYTITISSSSSLSEEQGDDQDVETQTNLVTHLESVSLPEGIPSSISSLMKYIYDSKLSSNCFSKDISLTQELCIDSSELDTGPNLSRRLYKKRLLMQEQELMDQRAKWLATPLRHRGLLYSYAFRSKGRFLLLSAYRFPNRPRSMVVRCHYPFECSVQSLSFSFPAIISDLALAVDSNTSTWSGAFLREVAKTATRRISLKRKSAWEYTIHYSSTTCPVTELLPLPSCLGSTYLLQLSSSTSTKHSSPQYFKNPQPIHAKSSYLSLISSIYAYNWSILRVFRPLDDEAAVFSKDETRLKPRRDVGKGIRVCSKSTTIDRISVIITLYLLTDSSRRDIPDKYVPVYDDEGFVDDNAMLLYYRSIINRLNLRVEIYIPSAAKIDTLQLQLTSCCLFVANFSKEDLFRFVDSDLTQFYYLILPTCSAYYEDQEMHCMESVLHVYDKLIGTIIATGFWKQNEEKDTPSETDEYTAHGNKVEKGCQSLPGARGTIEPETTLEDFAESRRLAFYDKAYALSLSYLYYIGRQSTTTTQSLHYLQENCALTDTRLCWSAEIFRKAMKIDNEEESASQLLLVKDSALSGFLITMFDCISLSLDGSLAKG